ncbi:LysR family transcriptional regulator, partial [Micromonospora azadirachtae]
MELRHLEYFVAVAEERHFTRAAERMRVAQSGLSASIRALERDLDAELFVRSTRRVELTDAGRALLAEAHRTLASAA